MRPLSEYSTATKHFRTDSQNSVIIFIRMYFYIDLEKNVFPSFAECFVLNFSMGIFNFIRITHNILGWLEKR